MQSCFPVDPLTNVNSNDIKPITINNPEYRVNEDNEGKEDLEAMPSKQNFPIFYLILIMHKISNLFIIIKVR